MRGGRRGCGFVGEEGCTGRWEGVYDDTSAPAPPHLPSLYQHLAAHLRYAYACVSIRSLFSIAGLFYGALLKGGADVRICQYRVSFDCEHVSF